MPLSEVHGVLSFYSFFTTVPRGEHTIRVCLGTACYVRGGKQVLEKFEKELGIGTKDTTEDRQFSLEDQPLRGRMRPRAGSHRGTGYLPPRQDRQDPRDHRQVQEGRGRQVNERDKQHLQIARARLRGRRLRMLRLRGSCADSSS